MTDSRVEQIEIKLAQAITTEDPATVTRSAQSKADHETPRVIDVDNDLDAQGQREPDGPGAEADVVEVEDVADYDDEEAEVGGVTDEPAGRPRIPRVRLATIFGLVVLLALGGLTGWLGFRAHQSHQADEQRTLFLSVGRQGALNLTTIDWHEADTDVARILDSATGTFHDDFQKRSQPFIDAVKQAQSKSVGTITEAGLESESDNDAQVLVAVAVKTTNAAGAEQRPRAWRMRISVQKVGDQAKVSNVEFVP
jgi:Mce-associated membrane protein